jgi:iron complex outermembrane receptor protein
MHTSLFKCTALACTLLSFQALFGQSEEPLPTVVLEDFVVSAGPIPQPISEFASPVNLISEATLKGSSPESLGDALDWQPGVSASSFAAGASRPILRGFDGPRVRILNSGLEALDASATSPDHGVAVEPLLVEQVEIIRGPATLLYGSSAIGGVVNTIGREIPQAPVPGGSTGAIETRYDTGANGKTVLGYTQFGTDQFALSFTGLTRRSDDYDIPGNSNTDGSGSEDSLVNSFVETDSFSAGGSWFFSDTSHLGLAYTSYNSFYGIPGEDVAIDLESDSLQAEFEVLEPSELIDAVRVRAAYTDYAHAELEGGGVGTIFTNEGWELRAEAAHAPIQYFERGLIGAQISDNELTAIGDEAFTPKATTQNQAIFISEHAESGSFHYDLGARLEWQQIDTENNQSYNDLALSIAGGLIWDINETHSLSLNLQRAQRHPTSTELFARGPHLATEQYEVGAADLDIETAYGVDLTFRSQHGKWDNSMSIFYTHFEDYVYLQNQGFQTDGAGVTEFELGFDVGEALDTYQFTAVDARFWGFEAETDYTLYQSEDTAIQLGFMADYVNAGNLDSGNPLPRIPPLRIGTQFSLAYSTWEFSTQLRYAFSQNDTEPGETETDGYTELNLNLSKAFELTSGNSLTLFARASNLLDEEIRNSTSFLKEIAPQPGRSFGIGARYEF